MQKHLEHLRYIEEKCRYISSSASVAREQSPENHPDFLGLKNYFAMYGSASTKELTAVQSDALSGSTLEMHTYFNFKPERQNFSAPDVSGFSVLPFSKIESVQPNSEETIQKINNLLEIAAAKLLGEDKTIYIPFIETGKQVEITAYVQQLLSKLKSNIREELVVCIKPFTAEIIAPVTRGFLYPMATPVNLDENDFDSGDCDAHLNTSFRRGDQVSVLAKYKEPLTNHTFWFVEANNRHGWISSANAVDLDQEKTARQPNDMVPYFYTESEPYFDQFGHVVLLPGDTLYFANGSFGVKTIDNNKKWIFRPLPDISEENVRPVEISEESSLQEVIDFAYNLKLPYMWSVYDCSEVLRRIGLQLGFDLQKYSGDAMVQIQQMFGAENTSEATQESDLDALNDGVYVANLLYPIPDSESFSSKHMFLITIKNGNVSAFSYAFAILGDEGYEEPIGAHVSGKDGLNLQFERGRKLSLTKIAA